jgi:hypothetical protein
MALRVPSDGIGMGDPAQSTGGQEQMYYETTYGYARCAASEELNAGAERPAWSSVIDHRRPTKASASGTQTGSTGRTGVGVTRSGFVLSRSTSISEEFSVSRGPPQ